VLLARALAVQAPVLLLDEPTTHLDAPHQRALVRGLVARARAGVAVAAVLHDLTLALAADRIVVLAAGRVRADGTPTDAHVRRTLVEVFDHALSIEPVGTGRYAALPALEVAAGPPQGDDTPWGADAEGVLGANKET
jgi:iron complex transport system ATP-binding protein